MAKETLDSNVNTAVVVDLVMNLLVPIIILTISLLLLIFVARSSALSIPVLEEELMQKGALVQRLESKVNILYKLTDYRRIVGEYSALVDKAMPSEATIPVLLSQVDTIAKNSGLVVARLTYDYGDTPIPDTVNIVGARLIVDGTYAQMLNFLDSLENSARIVNIESLSFSLLSEGNRQLVYNAFSSPLSISFTMVAPYMTVQSNAVTDEDITLDISDRSFTNFINKVKTLEFYDEATYIKTLESTASTTTP